MTEVEAVVEQVFSESYPVVLASISRFSRDIDLAEEAVQDALAQALIDWPRRGIPDNPPGWISTVARRKSIDRIRRRENLARKHQVLAGYQEAEGSGEVPDIADSVGFSDDRLEMIFACCHPALDSDKQVALTLRTVGGLTTGEIARAFLVAEPAMAQRLVRAKTKIRDAGIPFKVPEGPELVGRAVAIGEAYGPDRALEAIGELGGDLDGYHGLHTARAHFLDAAGRPGEAADAYRRALELVDNDSERRFLKSRLAGVSR